MIDANRIFDLTVGSSFPSEDVHFDNKAGGIQQVAHEFIEASYPAAKSKQSWKNRSALTKWNRIVGYMKFEPIKLFTRNAVRYMGTHSYTMETAKVT